MQEVARLEHEYVEQLRALADASVAINSSLTVEAILQLTADTARSIIRSARATVAVLAPDPRLRPLTATSPPRLGGGDPQPARLQAQLTGRGKELGVLEVDRRPRAASSPPRDEAILTQLAQLASVAISNAQLYDRERTIARTLQRSLRPGGAAAGARALRRRALPPGGRGDRARRRLLRPLRGRRRRLDGADRRRPGQGPGRGRGDRARPPHDARGGRVREPPVRRARACCTARCATRPATRAASAPSVTPTCGSGATASALELACGGHPLPLVVHPDGRVTPVGRLGTLLGSDIEPLLTDVAVQLGPGDVLVFYTDGVTEVRRRRQEVFGHGELVALLKTCAGLPPDAVADRVEAAVHRRLGRPAARRHGDPGLRPHTPTQGDRWLTRRTRARSNGQQEARDDLLRELVAHLRNNRTDLRQEWARRIGEARLLTALTEEEIFSEATSVYDNYVEVLETGSVEALQDYARNLSERIIPRGVETDEVLGIVLLLRDVLARSLFEKYQADFQVLNEVLDAYEPAANRIANTVGVNFVQERERIIRQQQEAIRELSTPVLQVRERLLILPIIGVLDGQRARQLTEQLLRGIRTNRARVVVIDITGVPAIDSTVANHLVQTVDASRLMGASVIITGLSLGDRADAGDARRGPVQGQRGRRPPGRHRGGRAAARLHRHLRRASTRPKTGSRPWPSRSSSRGRS